MSVKFKIASALTIAAALAVPALSHAEAAAGAAAGGSAAGGLVAAPAALASVVVVGAAAASNIGKSSTSGTVATK